MKYFIKVIMAVFIFVGITSCNNTGSTKNNNETVKQEKGTVKLLAPKAMYEVLKDDRGVQLIDVRTTAEYKVSHLKDAQNICITDTDFKDKVQDLDKDKPVYLYCKKGRRSALAAKILQNMGFKEIYDLDGGILKWQDSALEVVQ